MTVTISINNKKKNQQLLRSGLCSDVFKTDTPWEVSGCDAISLVKNDKPVKTNHLWEAVAIAHNQHYCLSLDPDTIWITILQGFMKHIQQAPALYAKRLGINFTDRKILTIIDNNAVKGGTTDWLANIKYFTIGVKEEIGYEKYNILLSPFSTTKALQQVAMEINFLGIYENYYSYLMMTLCGIPEIKLSGSKEDWQQLIKRLDFIEDFNLKWWTNPLRRVLSHFVMAYDDDIDLNFWKKIYSKFNVSGKGKCCSGWLLTFFPYIYASSHRQGQQPQIRSVSQNNYLDLWEKRNNGFDGVKTDSFPSSIVKVPFKWNYLGLEYSMEFLSGIIGVSQKDSWLKPEVGFGVREVVPV